MVAMNTNGENKRSIYEVLQRRDVKLKEPA